MRRIFFQSKSSLERIVAGELLPHFAGVGSVRLVPFVTMLGCVLARVLVHELVRTIMGTSCKLGFPRSERDESLHEWHDELSRERLEIS